MKLTSDVKTSCCHFKFFDDFERGFIEDSDTTVTAVLTWIRLKISEHTTATYRELISNGRVLFVYYGMCVFVRIFWETHAHCIPFHKCLPNPKNL